MNHAALLLLGSAILAAPPPLPSFAEAWCREVFEGNLAAAAKDYETLYLSQPSEKVKPGVQLKAALRAGLCFERLGLAQSARPAYLAVLKSSASTTESWSAGDRSPETASGSEAAVRAALLSESTLRLRELALGAAEEWPTDVATEVAVQGALDALRAAEKLRSASVVSLKAAITARRQRIEEREELLGRLAARGVLVSFGFSAPGLSSSGVVPGDEAAGSLRDVPLTDSDSQRVLALLRDRYFEAALLSLRAGNRQDAVRDHFALAVACAGGSPADQASGDGHAKVVWLGALLDQPFDISHAAAAADRRLVDHELERRNALCREIRARLDEDLAAETRGRRDQSLAPLDRIRDLLDWAGPSPREDSELRSLEGRARRRYLLLVRSRAQAETFWRLWSQVRSLVDQTVLLSEDLLDLACEDLRFKWPARAGGRADAVHACRAEAQRLLAAAVDAGSGAAQGKESGGGELIARDAASAVAERAIRQGLLLLDWVPAADPGGSLRATLTTAKAAMKKEAAAPAASKTQE